MRCLFLLLMLTASAWADERVWTVMGSSKETLMSEGLSEQAADAIIEHKARADAALKKKHEELVEAICSKADFYRTAPEHLANAIDKEADEYDALRASLAQELESKVSVMERQKLRDFEGKITVTSQRPVRYGDPIRYGQKSTSEVINTLCGGGQ